MPASCPYCGATLNFGLKFCVVCGRHTSTSEMTKLGGGLKGGMKQQDMTRRLDDNLSAGDFERARRPTRFRKHVKSLSEKAFYVFIGMALLFCAVRFTLQTFFPGKIHGVLAPILGKNTAIVEQTLTGHSADDDKKEAAEDDTEDKKPIDKTPPPSQKNKHHNRHSHTRHHQD